MEADWSVEVGENLPWIVVPWRDIKARTGFVDLRTKPEAAAEIPEVQLYPELGQALAALNEPESEVFTSKCDVWPVAADDLDPMELEASPEEAVFGVACYIDVLLRDALSFTSFELQEAWVRWITATLRTLPLTCARVEFTLRWAEVQEIEGFAFSLHVTGCGRDESSALKAWETALATVVPLVRAGVSGFDQHGQEAQSTDVTIEQAGE